MEGAGATVGASRAAIVLCDRYRLTRRIGRGGSADVFAGEDELLGRPVAVKLFRADVPAGGGLRRVEAEMRMVAGLRHPGLVTVYDAGLTSDAAGSAGESTVDLQGLPSDGSSASPFLVMELIDGVSLRHRLAQGRLTTAEAAAVGRSVAGTLAYVHAKGVVHRDVKPANILLDPHATDPRYSAKLADFGIARLSDSTHMTADGTTLGTANYLSPEQVLGSDVGPATDIYALGLVLLECLTGHVAYDGVGIEAALARLRRDPSIPEGLDRGWRELLTAMTRREPHARPTAEEVEHRLIEALAASSVRPLSPDAAVVARTSSLAQPTAEPPTDVLLGIGSDALECPAGHDGSRPLERPGPRLPRGRPRRWIALAGLVLAAAALALVLVVVTRPAGSTAPPQSKAPHYPTVSGPAGVHLRQLERSVG